MYENFQRTLLFFNYEIEKGRYVTFTKLYKDLKALELEIDFAYRHKALSHVEFNQLENEIENTLLLFRSWQEKSISD